MAWELSCGLFLSLNAGFSSTHEKICASDPDVQDFCDTVMDRIKKILSPFENQPASNRRISVEILKEASTTLSETESEAVKIISEQKEKVRKNPDLVKLVKEFFSTSSTILGFCNEIQLSIRRARENHKFVQITFDSVRPGRLATKSEMRVIFRELQKFREAETPFTEDFSRSFQAVMTKHEKLLKSLDEKKAKLQSKAGRAKVWRKVSSVICVAVIAALVICAVVTAAIPGIAAAGALAAAANFPLTPIGLGVLGLLGNDEEIKAQLELVTVMQVNTDLPINESNNIECLIDGTLNQISFLLNVICLCFKWHDRKALQLAMDNLKRTDKQFMEDLETLERHVSGLQQRMKVAMDEVLGKYWERK